VLKERRKGPVIQKPWQLLKTGRDTRSKREMKKQDNKKKTTKKKPQLQTKN